LCACLQRREEEEEPWKLRNPRARAQPMVAAVGGGGGGREKKQGKRECVSV
jgi:hypothetical protein